MTEFLAGCSSGIVQSLIGHPIDTIKILQQNREAFYKNPLHYYRGLSYPTAFNLLATGVTFDLNSRIKKLTGSHYSSGFITGGLIAPVIFLFDVGKIHHQMNPTKFLSWRKFLNPNGIWATLIRESVSNGFYMGIYFDMEERNGALLSGGIAGLACWTVTYPIDVIKTRQMTHAEQNLSFYNAYKMGGLWKGFTACAIRAVLVNAAGFWTYNKIKGLEHQ
jgi:solute carrier family 25 carnitine/acylcarnitine transporter 20/29